MGQYVAVGMLEIGFCVGTPDGDVVGDNVGLNVAVGVNETCVGNAVGIMVIVGEHVTGELVGILEVGEIDGDIVAGLAVGAADDGE